MQKLDEEEEEMMTLFSGHQIPRKQFFMLRATFMRKGREEAGDTREFDVKIGNELVRIKTGNLSKLKKLIRDLDRQYQDLRAKTKKTFEPALRKAKAEIARLTEEKAELEARLKAMRVAPRLVPKPATITPFKTAVEHVADMVEERSRENHVKVNERLFVALISGRIPAAPLADALNRKGIPTRKGKPWTPGSIRGVMHYVVGELRARHAHSMNKAS